MTSFIYDNAKIWMDGVDYSGEGNSLAVEYTREAQDATGFGHTVRGNRLGIAQGVFSVSGYMDHSTNDVYTRHNSADTPVITAVNGGAVGDNSFFMQAIVAQFNPIDGGEVGGMNEFSFNAQTAVNGKFGNGKILQNATITANGNTAIQSIDESGAASTEELKAALQVTAKTGTSPTLNEIVQGGTDSTMTLGARFISQEAENSNNLNSIKSGNSRFMMADDTNVYVAPDSAALVWTKYATGISGGTIKGVAFGNSTWVVVGTNGKILSSTDNGATWTARTSGASVSLNSICYAESLFVVVGAFDGVDAVILTSPDGITWTARTSGTTQELHSVYGDGTNFVSVGAAGVILHSADAITWSIATDSETETVNTLSGVYGDGTTWVAVGNSGTIITSTDRDAWTTRTSGTAAAFWDVINVASNWYATRNDGLIQKSSDAITWTIVPQGPGVDSLLAITHNGSDRIVVAGNNGRQFHSTGPINLITFDQMTDVGSNGIKTLSGPFPFTHFRTSHTIGGTASPSFDTVVASAVGEK